MDRLDAAARRRLLQTCVWGLLPGVVVLGFGVLMARAVDRPFALLVRDVSVAADLPYYSGAIGGLTIMVWTAGAAVPLAASLPRWRSTSRLVRTALVFGLLTLALGADDQFQVHEAVLPRIGVPEEVVLASYVLWGVTAAAVYRDELGRRPEGAVLVLAGLLLAGSIGVDVVDPFLDLPETPRILVEDGLKLLGATAWGAAMLGLAAAVHREVPAQAATGS